MNFSSVKDLENFCLERNGKTGLIACGGCRLYDYCNSVSFNRNLEDGHFEQVFKLLRTEKLEKLLK